jgi:glycosyltransferase involved in cell wall biosynthesis
MVNSVHTARWLDQISGQGWDIHVFPWRQEELHPSLHDLTVHGLDLHQSGLRNVRQPGAFPSPFRPSHTIHNWLRRGLGRVTPSFRGDRTKRLAGLIRRLKPDIVHSLEMQGAGYLTLDAYKSLKGGPPPWIVTNWGSDIYLFGRLAEHRQRIKDVLAAADFYSCECHRDVQLARDMGFHGEVLPVLPNSGGFDNAAIARLRQPGAPSTRRLILVKGYQSWAGRALVALRALALCADELRGYRVAIYAASPDVAVAAELLSQSIGVPIEVVPRTSHDEMLRLFGQARIYLGLSISDAISTSLLEAMAMGAFPIQSCTACADEWIENGRSGLIVPPEDPELVAAALRRALREDTLVDQAAELNAVTARERLDRSVIQPQVVAMYERVARSNVRNRNNGIAG